LTTSLKTGDEVVEYCAEVDKKLGEGVGDAPTCDRYTPLLLSDKPNFV
jgi:hypothetical protein